VVGWGVVVSGVGWKEGEVTGRRIHSPTILRFVERPHCQALEREIVASICLCCGIVVCVCTGKAEYDVLSYATSD